MKEIHGKISALRYFVVGSWPGNFAEGNLIFCNPQVEIKLRRLKVFHDQQPRDSDNLKIFCAKWLRTFLYSSVLEFWIHQNLLKLFHAKQVMKRKNGARRQVRRQTLKWTTFRLHLEEYTSINFWTNFLFLWTPLKQMLVCALKKLKMKRIKGINLFVVQLFCLFAMLFID